METDTLTHRPSNGQLILVPHKDTIRLLEVYVKRSLSLNDGTLGDKKSHRKEKWVTVRRKERRHSSDPSLHLIDGFQDSEVGPFSAVDSETKEPETIFEEPEKPTKKSKKIKKPSLFKNIFGIFSRKSTEDKSEDEEGPPETTVVDKSEGSSDTLSNCLPTTPSSSQRRKSSRKKSRRRKISKRLSIINKPNNNPDITRIDGNCLGIIPPNKVWYKKQHLLHYSKLLLMSVFRCGQCWTNIFLLWEDVRGTGTNCARGPRKRGSSTPFGWWETLLFVVFARLIGYFRVWDNTWRLPGNWIGQLSFCDASQSRMIHMKKEFQVRRDLMRAVQQPAHVFSWLFLFFLRGSHQQALCFDQGTRWCHRWKGGCYTLLGKSVFICLWHSLFLFTS